MRIEGGLLRKLCHSPQVSCASLSYGHINMFQYCLLLTFFTLTLSYTFTVQYIYIFVHTCIYIHFFKHIYKYIYIYAYIYYIYTHTYKNIYIYIDIYSYSLTNKSQEKHQNQRSNFQRQMHRKVTCRSCRYILTKLSKLQVLRRM